MEELLYVHQTFEKLVAIGRKMQHKEFEGCIFKQCDFSNSDFSFSSFTDCEFIDCNLSMIQLVNTKMQTVRFLHCKALGIAFQKCNDFLFKVDFEDCVLDYASFAGKKMPKTTFISCVMKEVNFMGSNLTQAVFDHCNLENAIFDETQLGGADFTTAVHYRIDPERNPMKKAQFSTSGIMGLLEQYDIKIT